MSKKDWKKQLLRMKQLADQNLGRSEKSEVLTDDLQLLERQINQIKEAWQMIVKKLQTCLIPYNGEAEKRLRKLPEYAFSCSLGDLAVTFNNETVLGKMFSWCGEAQMYIAKGLVHYTMDVEAKVIHPAQILLERDIPSILKLRRQLANMTLDMDSAKSRYQALCKQTQNAATSVRLDSSREEFEEAEAKVEHCKDVFATEMYSFFAREEELCKMLLSLLESQSSYHRQSIDALDRLIPLVREEMEMNATRPVFGFCLEEHLRLSKREVASVIEDCVVTIIRKGLDVEGIFRLAPAASKVKKLKAAFDANMVDMDEFEDIHCFCAALKHYLRELPQPIMTFELYNDWLQAIQRPPNERLNALWVVVDKLPKFNYINLRYLIKFLAKVVEHSDVNKMNASNLGIVIGPNLLWPPGENRGDIQHTAALALIVETLIGSSEWFFPGDIDLPSVGNLTSNTSSSSLADVTSQKTQAKMAFLANSQNDGGSSSSFKTSSSSSSLVGQSAAVSETKLTESVASTVFKPPRKVKKTAPAPPVPAANHHQRSASVTVLASNVSSMMQEMTSMGAARQDDLLDRKTATLSRPRFPPPARPTVPQLEKTGASLQPEFSDTPKDLMGKHEHTDGGIYHKESSNSVDRMAGNSKLELPSNFSKKLVSRSLDDVVSESRLGENYPSVSGTQCFESETVSDTEEVFPHHQSSDTSSDTALNLESGLSRGKVESQIEEKCCPDEKAAVDCLDEILSSYEPSKTFESSADCENRGSVNKNTSAFLLNSERNLCSLSSDDVEQKTWLQQNKVDNYLDEPLALVVKSVDVSVVPPTPEASSHQKEGLYAEPEPPFIDEGEEYEDASDTVYKKPIKESNKSYSDASPAGIGYNSSSAKGENSETSPTGMTVALNVNTMVGQSQQKTVVTSSQSRTEIGTISEKRNAEVLSKSKMSLGAYGDQSQTETEIVENRRPEISIMPYKDRHQVNMETEKRVREAVASNEAPANETYGDRERCNVRILAYKDRDKIMNVKSDNASAAGETILSGSSYDKYDDSVRNRDANHLNVSDDSIGNLMIGQDALKAESAKFSSASFATSVGGISVTDHNVADSAVASSDQSSSYSVAGHREAGVSVPSQAKPSDHSEMVQSLKLFFLSDKTPATPTRGRSNSDVDRYRQVTGPAPLQHSPESAKDEDGVRFGSSNVFSTGSQSNGSHLSSSASNQAFAARFSSSSDISERAQATASQRERFFTSSNSSVPVHPPPSFTSEVSGTGGTDRLLRPGVPPPPPVRRNRPSDSGASDAIARRSSEDASKIIEDTRL